METCVKEIMKPSPEFISPDATIKEAASKMETLECGVLPVGSEEKARGIITDRDIVVRVVAQGRDPAREKVGDYMTEALCYCNDNDTLEKAAQLMHANHVNRLLVKDDSGQTCGILSFGNILRNDSTMEDIHRVLECTVGKKAA